MNARAISLEAVQNMGPLRLTVTSREKGFVARNSEHTITAFGQTPAGAAENARTMAISVIAKPIRPTILLLRFDEPGTRTIVMQSVDRPVAAIVTAAT